MFYRKSLIVIGLLLSSPSWADSGAAERIRQINEEIAVLSAQLQKLEVESKIIEKTEKNRQLSSGPIKEVRSESREVPTVKTIDGVDGKLRARLSFRDGTQIVSVGDSFGQWQVKEISVNSVVLQDRDGKRTRLLFGDVASKPFADRGAVPGGMPGMPVNLPGMPPQAPVPGMD